jgi:hypothetical protein
LREVLSGEMSFHLLTIIYCPFCFRNVFVLVKKLKKIKITHTFVLTKKIILLNFSIYYLFLPNMYMVDVTKLFKNEGFEYLNKG